jgi:hypothetical protein
MATGGSPLVCVEEDKNYCEEPVGMIWSGTVIACFSAVSWKDLKKS